MNSKRYPAAMEKEGADLAVNGAGLERMAKDILQEARKLLKKNPDLAKLKVAEAKGLIGSFRKTLQALQKKQDGFDAARRLHAEKIQKAEQSIHDSLAYLAGLKENEYFIFSDKELAAARQDMKSVQDALSERNGVPDYLLVVKYAESAAAKAAAVHDKWGRRLAVQRANSDYLAELFSYLSLGLSQELKDSCKTALGELKTKAPSEVWKTLADDIEEKEAAAETELRTLANMARRLNGMDQQDFEAAAETIRKINSLRKAVKSLFEQPAKSLRDFIEAQTKAGALASQAEQAISQAEGAVSDSDAQGAGSTKLQEAKEKVSKAKDFEKSGLPNWLLVAGLLAGAVASAQTAGSEARNRADEVERARRRKQREEEESRKRSYYSHSSSWSSGSSFGGHSSGGGGFGGGSFGGGGASGKW